MSEKYPRAWGVAVPVVGGWGWESAFDAEEFADDVASGYEGWKVVELIPLPEHEAIVAAAVKAERERLTSIIRSINPCDIEDSRPTFAGATLRYVLDKIHKVPS